jgi:hypothetical protein
MHLDLILQDACRLTAFQIQVKASTQATPLSCVQIEQRLSNEELPRITGERKIVFAFARQRG